jgi:hypothetical protein
VESLSNIRSYHNLDPVIPRPQRAVRMAW